MGQGKALPVANLVLYALSTRIFSCYFKNKVPLVRGLRDIETVSH